MLVALLIINIKSFGGKKLFVDLVIVNNIFFECKFYTKN